MSEVFEALSLLEKERGIPVDFMVDRIKKAIVTACKNSYGNEDTVINMDPETGVFEVYLRKTVVEDVEEPGKEILLEKAREIDPTATAGDTVSVHLNTKEFGRIAAQTARNIIRQGIRDGERGQMMQEFQSKHQELVSALVERIDPRTGAAARKARGPGDWRRNGAAGATGITALCRFLRTPAGLPSDRFLFISFTRQGTISEEAKRINRIRAARKGMA